MKHSLRRALLLLLGFWLVGCDSDPQSSLTITSIEINQGTQTSTNTISLVAQRSTTVRVMLETGSSNDISNVSGLLSVTVDGVFITPVGGLEAVNAPITVPANPDRDSENDSLYFELAAPTNITESSDVDFFVAVAGNGQVVQAEALNLSFTETSPSVIHYASVDYTPSGLGFPDPALIEPGVGDAFVKGIYPVDDSDASLYQQLLAPGVGFSQDADGDGILNCVDNDGDGEREDCSDPNDLISGLASMLALVVFFGANSDDLIYGWLAGNPIAGNGLGQVGGSVAYGNTQESRHQRTFAHELGHNFGLSHNSRTLDQTGWDTLARLEDNPTANNTTGRVKDTSLFDVMVGGRLTANAWVDTTTYNFFLSSPLLALQEVQSLQAQATKGVLVVQGRFDPSGERLEKIEPAFRFPWTREGTQERPDDPYLAEVLDDQGTVYRRTFNALVADDGEVEEETYGFFEVRLPVPPERRVVGLRIRNARNLEQIYFSTTATEPPTITITAPQPGASLGETTTVSWRVVDPDSEASAMQFQIAYSHDGGESWVPLAVDLPGSVNSVVVNTREIQKSDAQGVIRVFVSDGLNTNFDNVERLSTPRAIY
jgi:hypothetical protein